MVVSILDARSSTRDAEFSAQNLLGTGRGALILAMFGAGWLGWGLGQAKAFNGITGPAFGSIELLLLLCSVYVIRKGRLLRKRHPSPAATRQPILKPFLLVAVVELLSLFVVSLLASRLHRPDLSTNWCAMVVGLHFLPLAKILRAPNFTVIGILITLWGALCWVLFRGNALVISASIGTGVLLWAISVSALLRARQIARSLRR